MKLKEVKFLILSLFLCYTTFGRTQYSEEVLKYSKSKEDSIKALLIGTWKYDKTYGIAQRSLNSFDTVYIANTIDTSTTFIFDKGNIIIIKVVDCLVTQKIYKYEVISSPGQTSFGIDIIKEEGGSSIGVEKIDKSKMTTISHFSEDFRDIYIKKE